MLRRLLSVVTLLSLVLCLVLAWLRARSADTTDVLMLALPGGHCLLLTSHEGKWLQVTGVGDWPDGGVRHWSASRNAAFVRGSQSWREAGPFLFWQRHTVAQRAGMWFVRGTLVVPTDDGGKLPAYGDGYARADASNAWAGVLPSQPGWLFLSGWEIRLPHTYLIGLAGLLPLVVVPVWLLRVARRLRRPRVGLCPGCGYDIRATPDRCPECGLPVASATSPAGTVPAATGS